MRWETVKDISFYGDELGDVGLVYEINGEWVGLTKGTFETSFRTMDEAKSFVEKSWRNAHA